MTSIERKQPGAGDEHPYRFVPGHVLRGQSEFDRAYQGGRRSVGRNISLQVVANGLGHCRLGMAVSRKVGGAVVRNRIRRSIREAFRLRQHEFSQSCDMVVVPRRGWTGPSVAAIGDELVALVDEAVKRGKST